MTNPTDEELLAQVRLGEHGAFLVLFDRYYAPIEQYAIRMLQDGGAARNAAAATFERAFHDARKDRCGRSNYVAHLFRICRRQIIRRTPREMAPEIARWPKPEYIDCEVPELEELPLKIILCAERDALIQAAMDSLPFEDREILHLAFESCLCRDDIGPILREPSEEAVTARLYRSLRKLGAAVIQAAYLPDKRGEPRNSVKHWART